MTRPTAMPETPELNSPLPAEAYEEQRRKGFRWLRFGTELEQRYQRSSSSLVEYQTNVALVVGLGIWLAFLALDYVRWQAWPDIHAWPIEMWKIVVIRTVVLACLATCTLAMLQKEPLFDRRRVTAGILCMVSLASCLINALYGQLGVMQEVGGLLLLIIALFLPMGLRLKECMGLALISVAMVLILSVLMPLSSPTAQPARLAISMLIAAALGTLSAYQREYGLREQFLLRAELECMARLDVLTGLLNRRAFNEHLGLALASARREGKQVALMLIDVDHFKLYNDAFGHAAGDQALQTLAPVLKSLCGRPLDHAARVGGEEMCVVLYDVHPQHLEHLCRSLLDRVDALALSHGASPSADRISVSAGCTLSLAEDDAQSLYRRADQLLYQAKHRGRNRACTDQAQDVLPSRLSDNKGLQAPSSSETPSKASA
ncbi:MAG: hypothetical protein C4K60_06375 [Ideonella sp. MAG2]|nr:MAG: hypothetical protein C4K60_06375 [Ideonella sp. MAG2]